MDYVDYTDCITTPIDSFSKSNQVVSMETEGNSHQQSTVASACHQKSQHEGYVAVVDYTESSQLPGNLTNKAASRKAEEGYVGVMDYTASHQFPGSLPDQAAPMKAEEGYVGVVDYTNSVPHQSGSFCNKSTSNDSSLIFRDGYENLSDSSVRSEESGYTQLRKQPHEYLEILAEPETLRDHSGNTCPQNQHVGYVAVVDYPDSIENHQESLSNRAVSITTEKECKDIHPQSQHGGYVDIVEYTDSPQTHAGSFMDKAVPGVTEDECGYTRLQRELDGYEKLRHCLVQSRSTSHQSLSHGYVDISEYSDSNVTTRAGSMETESQSGHICSQSQYEGYVGIVVYSKSTKSLDQGLNNVTVLKETEEDANQRQCAGHVDIIDYAESFTSYSETSKNKDNFWELKRDLNPLIHRARHLDMLTSQNTLIPYNLHFNDQQTNQLPWRRKTKTSPSSNIRVTE